MADARNELAGDLEAFAASIYGADFDEGEDVLLARQKQVIDDWFIKQEDWLGDARIDFQTNASLGFDDESRRSPLSALEELVSSGRLSESAVLALEKAFGTDSESLGAELYKTRTDNAYWDQAERLFKSQKEARIASTVLVSAEVLPLLPELAALVRTLQSDPTPARERLVAELRSKVRDANEQAVDEALAAAGNMLDAVRTPLAEDIDQRETILSTVAGERAEQADYARRIGERIDGVRAVMK